MSQFVDITGLRFGKLVATEYVGKNEYRHSLFRFKCDCGNTIVRKASDVMSGRVVSCGCEPNRKPSKYPKRLRNIFAGMKRRCYGMEEKDKTYWGRGITICDEWLTDANNFFEWSMANGYTDELTIDRIDGDKGYSPENCRWITKELNSALAGLSYIKKYHPEYL